MTRFLFALVGLVLFACSAEPSPAPLPPAATSVGGTTEPQGSASAQDVSAQASASAATTVSAATRAGAGPSASATAEPTTSAAAKPGEIDRIELRFQDASVPPPHHRSYTITLTPTRVRRVVDSYGDVLSDDAETLASGEFAGFVKSLQKLGLKSGTGKGGDGCTGGTSRSLVAFAGSARVIEVSSATCGGKESGPLALAKAWVGEVEKRAPAGGLGPKAKRPVEAP